MISALIENKENALILDFPYSIYDVRDQLRCIGIFVRPDQVFLTDNEEDDIRVKLYAESDIGNHLIRILNERNSLKDANTAAYAVTMANDYIKEDLEQQIIHDQYETVEELYADIRKMTHDAGTVGENSPIVGNSL